MRFEGILTEQALKDMPPNKVFATGEIENGPNADQIYMTNYDIGKKMRWVAQRGAVHDWTIYIHWADRTYAWIMNSGDKVINPANIQKLVVADESAMRLYRI